jgi:hypothetical protein
MFTFLKATDCVIMALAAFLSIVIRQLQVTRLIGFGPLILDETKAGPLVANRPVA